MFDKLKMALGNKSAFEKNNPEGHKKMIADYKKMVHEVAETERIKQVEDISHLEGVVLDAKIEKLIPEFICAYDKRQDRVYFTIDGQSTDISIRNIHGDESLAIQEKDLRDMFQGKTDPALLDDMVEDSRKNYEKGKKMGFTSFLGWGNEKLVPAEVLDLGEKKGEEFAREKLLEIYKLRIESGLLDLKLKKDLTTEQVERVRSEAMNIISEVVDAKQLEVSLKKKFPDLVDDKGRFKSKEFESALLEATNKKDVLTKEEESIIKFYKLQSKLLTRSIFEPIDW